MQMVMCISRAELLHHPSASLSAATREMKEILLFFIKGGKYGKKRPSDIGSSFKMS